MRILGGDRRASREARWAVTKSRRTIQVPTRSARSALNTTCSGCNRSGCPTGSSGMRPCRNYLEQDLPATAVRVERWLRRELEPPRSDRSWRRGTLLREILAWIFSFASSALRIGTACGWLVERALRGELRCNSDSRQGHSHAFFYTGAFRSSTVSYLSVTFTPIRFCSQQDLADPLVLAPHVTSGGSPTAA